VDPIAHIFQNYYLFCACGRLLRRLFALGDKLPDDTVWYFYIYDCEYHSNHQFDVKFEPEIIYLILELERKTISWSHSYGHSALGTQNWTYTSTCDTQPARFSWCIDVYTKNADSTARTKILDG
jgi:hypothetical protein